MIHLAVWLTLPDASTLKVGELACTDADEGGRYESEFAYDDDWLSRRRRFALDPVSLPLGRGRYRSTKFEPPLAVFEDALPDDWGRGLIVRALKLPRRERGEPFLLREMAAHGLGLGALGFSPPDGAPPSRWLPADRDLRALSLAAERFEAGRPESDVTLQRLFVAGGSPGGARPKVLVSDETGDWIAKFPSRGRDDRFDIVGLEATGLDLAAAAGIAVPEHRVVALGARRRRALLVRRFDVTAAGGRRHMISLRTLCRERPGAHVLAYSELAETLRRVSATPQDDVTRLFRWMTFNAAFGNTDDHLKNFWMVHDDAGYRLSEAFDLLPDVGERGEHCLAFQYGYGVPTGTELSDVARRWGVSDSDDAIAAVLSSTRRFAAVAKAHDVPPANIKAVAEDLARRRARLEK